MRASKTKTEIRQDQIATAALELMACHGPRALNLAGLGRKVGVVPSAIYRHYAGKDAVLDAVLDLIDQRLQANVQAVRQETPDALERLQRLLIRHVQLIQNNIAIPRVVFSEEIFSGHAKRRQRVCRIIQGYLAAVEELVRQGQRDKSLRTNVPADTVSVMFLGLIQPAVILWLMSDGSFDVAAHTQRAWRIFGRSIQADRSPELSASTTVANRDHKRNEKRERKATMKRKLAKTAMIGALLGAATLLPLTAKAHCDIMDGPVVLTAKAALKENDLTPVLKWVKQDAEAEIKAAFIKTLSES